MQFCRFIPRMPPKMFKPASPAWQQMPRSPRQHSRVWNLLEGWGLHWGRVIKHGVMAAYWPHGFSSPVMTHLLTFGTQGWNILICHITLEGKTKWETLLLFSKVSAYPQLDPREQITLWEYLTFSLLTSNTHFPCFPIAILFSLFILSLNSNLSTSISYFCNWMNSL